MLSTDQNAVVDNSYVQLDTQTYQANVAVSTRLTDGDLNMAVSADACNPNTLARMFNLTVDLIPPTVCGGLGVWV